MTEEKKGPAPLRPLPGPPRPGMHKGPRNQGDTFAGQPKADAVTLSFVLNKTGGSIAREPSLAVSFIRHFHARLGLPQDLLNSRVRLLRTDPLSFFRSTPALFHTDLGGNYATKRALTARPAPHLHLVGDAQLGNFGTYRGRDGRPRFGITDFDQAGVGSPEADLQRLSTSLVLMARKAGVGLEDQLRIAHAVGVRYFEVVAERVREDDPEEVGLSASRAAGPVRELLVRAHDTSRQAFLQGLVDDPRAAAPKFQLHDKQRSMPEERKQQVAAGLLNYARALQEPSVAVPLQLHDAVLRLANGFTSYGLLRFYVLVAAKTPGLPYVLEVKHCLPNPVNDATVELKATDARKIVAAMNALGGVPNPLSGVATIAQMSMLVRELEPEKGSFAPDQLTTARELESVGVQAAEVLARAHCHRGHGPALVRWIGSDADKASKVLAGFARAYADQTEADHGAFLKATGK